MKYFRISTVLNISRYISANVFVTVENIVHYMILETFYELYFAKITRPEYFNISCILI